MNVMHVDIYTVWEEVIDRIGCIANFRMNGQDNFVIRFSKGALCADTGAGADQLFTRIARVLHY